VLVAGVELGGTKCICLLGSGPQDVRERRRVDTHDPVSTLASIRGVLLEWHARAPLRALGVASFGPLDLDPRSATHGAVVSTPKPGWSGANLLGALALEGVPTGVDTDVNAAALAEHRWGGAQGLDHYVYVTVGTGIGVGTVVHGRPVRGLGHSEAGHLRVGRLPGDAWPGACPFHRDCVEGLASGPAVAARAGVPSEQLPATHAAWETVAFAIGGLLHNLVLTVAPQRILVGGGIALGQPHLLPRVRSALVASLSGYAHAAALGRDIDRYVRSPALGHDAGPLGALALGLAVAERT
jgi:fructokinase